MFSDQDARYECDGCKSKVADCEGICQNYPKYKKDMHSQCAYLNAWLYASRMVRLIGPWSALIYSILDNA